MRSLISIFLPQKYKLKETIDFESHFHLVPGNCILLLLLSDLCEEKLRKSVSTIAHKAYSCGKIHIIKEGMLQKGKKNLVQSMRYLMFGMQVCLSFATPSVLFYSFRFCSMVE